MTTFSDELLNAAKELAAELEHRTLNVVFAESCTAGLVSASLSRIPGMSRFLCGSSVVYQNATKTAWLNVPADSLADPEIGPVSAETAEAMALGVLRETSHARWSASVTGHLGPQAPSELDGVAFIGIARRTGRNEAVIVSTRRIQLSGLDADSVEQRWYRQDQAALEVLKSLKAAISAAE